MYEKTQCDSKSKVDTSTHKILKTWISHIYTEYTPSAAPSSCVYFSLHIAICCIQLRLLSYIPFNYISCFMVQECLCNGNVVNIKWKCTATTKNRRKKLHVDSSSLSIYVVVLPFDCGNIKCVYDMRYSVCRNQRKMYKRSNNNKNY